MRKIIFRDTFNFLISMAVLITAIYFFLSSVLDENISAYFYPDIYINALFNSNELAIPHLYLDLWNHHGHLSDWSFSPVPYFFPDALIGFTIAFFIHSIQAQVLLANSAELCLLYFLIVQIGQKINGKTSKNFFRLSGILLVVLASGHLHDREVLIPLWNSHFGSTVLVYLFGLWLILHYLISPQKNTVMILLALCSFLASFSDPFFFILFNGSLFFGLLALAKKQEASWSTCSRLFFIPLFFSILGLCCNFFDHFHLNIAAFLGADHEISKPIHYSWNVISKVQHTLALYYADNPITVLVSLFFLLFGIGLFFNAFRKKTLEKCKKNTLTHFVIITCSASVFLTVFSSFFLDHDFENPNFFGLRHFINALILPSFLCLPLLIAKISSPTIFQNVNRYYSLFMTILLTSLLIFNPIRPASALFDYYPPIAQCLDEHAKKGELFNKRGVTGYWVARVATMLSKENVQLVPTLSAKPYNWMNTKNDYRHQRFYFVLSRDITPVTTNWGKPDKHFVCSQDKHFSVDVYNKGFYIDQ